MQDYLYHNRRVVDDKISRKKEEEEKQKEKEKKIAAIPRVMAKAKTYQNHHQR